MRKIIKYAEKSELMNISIKYGNERFSFNLFEELKIDEGRINAEIKGQPSAYGFLSMLHKRLLALKSDKEMEVSKAYDKVYTKWKSRKDDNTNRPYANDFAESKAKSSKLYLAKLKALNKIKSELGIIETCVESFEQRGHLIQTISANIRKTQ